MNMKGNEMLILKGIAILGIVFLIGYLLTKIFQRVGILKDSKTIGEETDIKKLRESDYFSPLKHKQTPHKVLGLGSADAYAKRLRKAMRFAGTNEEEIYSVFRSLLNKINISEVAESYYNIYKKDLRTELFNELKQSEVSILKQIIDKLPNF